jgi:hypothetical protein
MVQPKITRMNVKYCPFMESIELCLHYTNQFLLVYLTISPSFSTDQIQAIIIIQQLEASEEHLPASCTELQR